ncbi:DUF397 domain-containing protein [Streptomyces sp. NPDC058239]|uniref:DUF397 domain-containing protein n=1 Tax=unclassified Streptomyces TaxID=2593676 RepID=UPI00365A35E3
MAIASTSNSPRPASDSSSRSGTRGTNDGPECVEVAETASTIHVRDSKNIPGPHLGFTPDAWAEFVAYASTS